MAEWLRHWTLDLSRALRAGSIPDTDNFFFFFNYDDGLATCSGAGERE